MNEHYWAEQFSSEVDGLLGESKRVSRSTAPAEYVEALEMARLLASLDFSVESRQRDTLRRRLLAEAREGAKRPTSGARPMAWLGQVWTSVNRLIASTAEHRLWLLLRSQVRVVQREIWVASALVMALGTLVTVAMSTPFSMTQTLPLVFIAPIVAAVGIAFLYGSGVDPALEIELATPISPRLILLARLVLVFGFDLGLGLVASAALSWSLRNVSLWPLVMTWLAPMAFLAALAFLITVLCTEPALGMSISLAVWIMQSMNWMISRSGTFWPFPDLTTDAARPWLWALAFLLVGLGLWVGGREEHWLRGRA